MMANQNDTAASKSGEYMDYLIISVITISYVSLALLTLDLFDPKTAFFLGMSIAISLSALKRGMARNITDLKSVGLAQIMAVMFFAIILRANSYPWINGAQDQGIYVSMSSHFQHGGKVFIEDNVLPRLNDSYLKDIYLEGRNRGVFHPGVYYGGNKDYIFQFYHLHPLWMAIFAEFFGDDARVFSLTFFSLLSIVFLCLLTFELSNSKCAALSVGVLLAINPLHAFFSKWPVTEVVALSFSSMGFYYLARAYSLSYKPNAARWALAIGAASLSLLFFVRISGFFYMPFLVGIYMAGASLYEVKGNRLGLDVMKYSLACVLMYAISVLYGLKYSHNYAIDMYQIAFGKTIDNQWMLVMLGGFSIMIAVMLLSRVALSNKAFVVFADRILNTSIPKYLVILLVLMASIISLAKVYLIAFSNSFSNDPVILRWNLSGSGAEAIVRSSVINWVLYSSPFLVLLGGFALIWRKPDIRLLLLMLAASIPFAVFAVSNPVIPYQYYYARYLLSEAVPYGIVVCIVAIFSGNVELWRRAGIASIMLTLPLFGYFSLKQFGAEEGVVPRNILRKIATHIESQDLLLINPEGWSVNRFLLETPLRFYFGLKTFALPLKSHPSVSDKLGKIFRNVWLLSPKPIDDERFILEDRLLHYDKVVERSGHIPTKLVDNFWPQELFLYALKKPNFPSMRGEPYKLTSGWHNVTPYSDETLMMLGEGWHAVEQHHVWSSARSIINLKKSMFNGDRWPTILKLDIAPFAANIQRPVLIEVREGEQRFSYNYLDNQRRKIELPIICPADKEHCQLDFLVANAASPQQLGSSTDNRLLGFALYAFSFDGFNQ